MRLLTVSEIQEILKGDKGPIDFGERFGRSAVEFDVSEASLALPLIKKFLVQNMLWKEQSNRPVWLERFDQISAQTDSFIYQPVGFLLKKTEEEFHFDFYDETTKAAALSQAEHFLLSHSKLSKFQMQSRFILDELMLNATISAPRAFNQIYGAGSPGLGKNRKCTLILATDEHELFIGCRDPFGSLRFHNVVSHLTSLFQEGPLTVNSPAAETAGIGCQLILDNCNDFFGASLPQEATLVGCLLAMDVPFSAFYSIPKTLNFWTL